MSEYPANVISSPETSAPFSRLRRWMTETLGLDRAILFTIFARGWASMAGLITVFLIARFLSPAEQGYYYTFGSLVALQIVFELGFSFVILQMTSHERAHLTISDDYVITGDPIAHARLASVLRLSTRWYSVAAVIMAAALIPAGLLFFSLHQHLDKEVAWRLPWCLVVLCAALTFQLDPILSFFEGCGFVVNVAQLRFRQAVTGSLLAWISLITHHGLFAPAMMIFGTASAALFWLFTKRRLLFGLLKHQPGMHRIHWQSEIWPFQWKIAISWLCGYFIFQLFNPVLFAFRGPVAAGQMGMSLSIANALQAIAISWLNTKSAPFGMLIARKEYSRLDHLFFRSLKQSIAVCSLGALIIWLGCFYLNIRHLQFALRLLDPFSLAVLLTNTIINITVFSEALYLRAHKQEKFLANSVISALFIGTSTYFLGKYFGPRGMVAGCLCISVIFSLGMGTITFTKHRKLWHGA